MRGCLHQSIHLPLQRSNPSIVLCCELPLLLRSLLLRCQMLLQLLDSCGLLCRAVLCYLQRLIVCCALRIKPGDVLCLPCCSRAQSFKLPQ